MRRLILLLTLALPLSAQSVVQFACNRAVTTSLVINISAAQTGNYLFASAGVYYKVEKPTSIEDDQGHTWTHVTSYEGGSYDYMAVKYTKVAAGTTSVTIHPAGSSTPVMGCVAEITGLASTDVVRVYGGQYQEFPGAAYSSGALAGVVSGDFLLSFHQGHEGSFTFTPDSGWNSLTPADSSGTTHFQSRIASSSGSYTSSGTLNTSAIDITSAIVALKPASAARRRNAIIACDGLLRPGEQGL